MKSYLESIRLFNLFNYSVGTDSFSKLIRKNILGGLIVKGSGIFINLLYVPLLINFLDSERYGIWIAITSFLTWFQFFDIGIGNGMRNKLAQALVDKDYTIAKKLVSTSYALIAIIFCGVALIFWLIASYINWTHFLHVTLIGNQELQVLTLIIFTGLCLRFIVQLIQPILMATQQSAVSAAFPALSNLIGLIAIYFVSKTSYPPLLAAGFILSGVPILVFITGSVILFSSSLKHLRPGFRYIKFQFARQITSIGFNFLFIQIAAVVLNSSASFILLTLFSPNDVTVYNIVFKYFQVILIINAIVVTPLWSGFAEKIILRDYEWIKQTFKRINRLSVAFSIAIVLMGLVSPWIIRLWVGNKVNIPVAVIFTMGIYFIQIVFISVYNMFINGSGKIKLSMYFTAFEIVVYVALAYLLSKYVMGVTGVIVASIITKSFTFILQYVQVNRIIDGTATGIWNK